MRFAPYSVCLALASLACGSSPTGATAVARPQLVAVTPADFMGEIGCLPQPNAEVDADGAAELALDPNKTARSYVATLFDVTPAADGSVPNPGTPLASSPPTTCVSPVTFAYVTALHRYVAEIDAYDVFPDQLLPISEGSRLLANIDDGTRALPRWTATCGGYPPSPYMDGGGDSAGAAGTAGDERPPGVVSYTAITRTPHDCGAGLQPPESD
jgi:hypothetical protein